MNRTRQRIYLALLILGFLVCTGIILALNFMYPDSSTAQTPDSVETQSDLGRQSEQDSKSTGAPHQNRSITVSDSLSHDLNEHGSGDKFGSKRAFLSFVSGATEQQLGDVFRDNVVNPTFIGQFNTTPWIQSVVLTKLVIMDAERAQSLIEQLDARTAKSVVYSVMCEWNQVHKDEAVKLLAPLDRELRSLGLRGLVHNGNRFSRSDLLEIGKELSFEESNVVRLLDQSQTGQTQISWRELEEEFENIDLKVSLDRTRFMRNAERYVKVEGLDSLSAVLELYDKIATEKMSQNDRISWNGSRSRLVASISQDDPQAVFEYVAQLGEDIDVDILSAVSKVWFAADPDAFWSRLNGAEFEHVRTEIAENVIRHWSWREPDLALISMDKFPKDYHDQMYIQIAHGMTRDSPLRALELLPLTSDWSNPQREESAFGDFSIEDSQRSFRISLIVSSAAKEDPIATIEWIDSDEAQLHESMKQEHLSSVFRRWSDSDPVKAFEMALQSPLQEGKTGAEASVVLWLAHENVDGAIELLPQVREGETKADAYRSVSRQLEEQDRITEAIQLGKDLPEHDREKYNQSLARKIGWRTSFDHLEVGIRQLPTQELQSEAARSALSHSMMSNYLMSNDLTEKQIDQLKEYLTDDDKQQIELMEDVDMKALMDKIPENFSTDEEGLKKLMKELNIE